MKQENTQAHKTEWNFKLFYQSESDPQIEKDLQYTEKEFSRFEKKYKKDSSYLTSREALYKALVEYEKIISESSVSRPYLYFFLRADVDSSNKKIDALFTQVESRLTKIRNTLIFFPLSLGTIDKKNQKLILKDKNFAHFHYYLKVLWEESKHNLTEKEEKLISLLRQPSQSMWVSGVEKVLNSKTIEHKGEHIPLSQAMGIVSELARDERIELSQKISAVLKSISDFAEAEINAVYTTKKITDELRGFEKPYSKTVMQYQNDIETVETLIDVVTKNFKIAHSFYAVKAKMMNTTTLDYAARSAKVGTINKSFDLMEGVNIVKSALSKVGQRYVDIFERYLTHGHIDMYPRVGKSSGAYCMGGDSVLPTFILHNYTDTFNSVNTLAHELGHAFHTELSSVQSGLYQDYTMSVAEVASTLFENFVFDEIFETLTDDEKIIALHDKINGSISTIFRQIACFNFELELNNAVREKGSVSKEEIASMMNRHMKAYLGPVFDLQDDDGYFFVSWSHVRRHFYVYSYAFGEIVSSALYALYKKDHSYMQKIETFLSAGGSKSPYQIFKDIGVDISSPEFYLQGLANIKKEIKTLEKLVEKSDLFKAR